MGSLTLTSPAKLNLMLHITGRRADGYHQLQTVFQFIDLFDRLHIEATPDMSIRRINSRTPVAQADDIVIRAAKLLQQRYGVHQGAEISIEKQIPVGGGLGGGSSNAASCLLALNTLWNIRARVCSLGGWRWRAINADKFAGMPLFGDLSEYSCFHSANI